MPNHTLKTDPEPFQAVLDLKKTFEIRLNDRDFHEGDILRLIETKYTGEEMKAGAPLIYTGREAFREVSHILKGPLYGLQDEWCILSIFGSACKWEV